MFAIDGLAALARYAGLLPRLSESKRKQIRIVIAKERVHQDNSDSESTKTTVTATESKHNKQQTHQKQQSTTKKD